MSVTTDPYMCGYPIQNFMKMMLERSKGKNNKNPCRDQCQLPGGGGGGGLTLTWYTYMCPPFGMLVFCENQISYRVNQGKNVRFSTFC